jgi:hypothetical protein
MALIGFESVSRMLPAPILVMTQRHSFVALCHSSDFDYDKEWRVLDFLPEHPTSPFTAATLLSGGRVAGRLRDKRIKGTQWMEIRVARVELLDDLTIECSTAEDVIDVHNAGWLKDRLDLSLFPFPNNCDSYTESLIQALRKQANG